MFNKILGGLLATISMLLIFSSPVLFIVSIWSGDARYGQTGFVNIITGGVLAFASVLILED